MVKQMLASQFFNVCIIIKYKLDIWLVGSETMEKLTKLDTFQAKKNDDIPRIIDHISVQRIPL